MFVSMCDYILLSSQVLDSPCPCSGVRMTGTYQLPSVVNAEN